MPPRKKPSSAGASSIKTESDTVVVSGSMPGQHNLMNGGGSTPRPDPTLLTTGQIERTAEDLRREIVHVAIVTDEKLNAVKQRFDAMDKAMLLLQAAIDRLPDSKNETVRTLEILLNERFKTHDEKFIGIEKQFTERDTRTEQMSLASKVAVDAALQAAKEAVGEQNKMNSASIAKSEAGFTKQIDQIGQLIAQQDKGSSDKIDDLKGRISSLEGRSKGTSESYDRIDDLKQRIGEMEGRSKGTSDGWGYVVGFVGIVISVLTLAFLAFDILSKKGSP